MSTVQLNPSTCSVALRCVAMRCVAPHRGGLLTWRPKFKVQTIRQSVASLGLDSLPAFCLPACMSGWWLAVVTGWSAVSPT